MYTAQQLRDIVSGSNDFKTQGLDEAMRFCTHLAKSHYENFPVGSLLVPRSKRGLIHGAYAFARIGDDIADEENGLSPDERIFLLKHMERALHEDVYTTSPIFIAMHHVMRVLNIPPSLPSRLLTAFRKDAAFQQPETFDDIESYCHFSANPVGELVLAVFEDRNEETIRFSNSICTALQMTNFWQDVSRDLVRDRVYIPASLLSQHNVDIHNTTTVAFEAVVQDLIRETRRHFENGKKLLHSVTVKRLRWELAFTIAGAECVLAQTATLGGKILESRPSLSARNALTIVNNARKIVA